MRIPSPPHRRPIVGRRALLATSMVAAMAVPSAALQTAQADPPTDSAGPRTDIVSWTSGRLAGTHRITLLTGDVVALHVTPDGRQSAWVVDPVDSQAPANIYELDGQVHVVPAEATPYVTSGAVDESLFNVTLLARSGYDDLATDELPLLVEAAPTRTSSAPDAPEGAEEVRELDSVDTVSVTAAKDGIRTTWEDLRGPRPARTDSSGGRLADGVTVWLNEKVRATLDQSVAQVGAPEAWEQGYDGDGTTVAVLDTGYDPGHPDLAGRVVGAQGFSAGSDTAVDGNGHGTHVAATVGGSGAASDSDRLGVAPGTELLIGKVLNDAGEGTTDEIIAGMEWAVEQGADVVNMSLGTFGASDGTDPLSQAVNDLTRSSDTLFVVAAGNTGPAEQTVGSPGAADLALTVGAVDKQDEPAAFSSRGPRFGDGAIKPEITAPGVDIVAARAAGTSLGNILDEYYTSLNGTSMATPHVAGAAAILAQRYPNWGAAKLKARLVSTAETQRDQPVTFQGGGRLDVAAAVGAAVTVNTGSMFLGQRADTSKPVSRKLTYRNTSDKRVSMRLSVDVTGAIGVQRPALRLSRSTLTIPANGTASVTATLTPRTSQVGSYAGQIVARPVGRPSAGPVHTTVAFSVLGPMRTVTVHAVDRAGRPASGPVDLWNADTGEYLRGFLTDGTTTFEVREGRYSLVAAVEQAGDWFSSTQHTIAGIPELRISENRTLRFDARKAEPIEVSTPRRTELRSFDVFWHRSIGDRSISMIAAQGFGEAEVYALPSPAAKTGSFRLATEWNLTQPILNAKLTGPDGFSLSSMELVSEFRPFVGDQTMPLVDAGAGTDEDFAAVDVDGAAALVSRGPNEGDLLAQAEAAAAAGAELLIAYNTSTDEWFEFLQSAPLPVYKLTQATGQRVLDALENDPDAALDINGIRDSTYQYALAYSEERRIPAGQTYDARPESLAIIKSDYRQNSNRMSRVESYIPYIDGMGVANSMGTGRRGPLVRTEYVNTDGVEWQRFGQPHEWLGYYWTSTPPTQYEAGERYSQVWWGPLVHPAVPTAGDSAGAPVLGGAYHPTSRYRDAIRMNLPHYTFGRSLSSTIYEQWGDRSEVTLERDGELVGTRTWPQAQWSVSPGEATYELSIDVVNGDGNWSDTSVRTSTTWRFDSARADITGEVLPLVQLGYQLDTDAYNAMPADSAYPLVIDPEYQPGASGPGRFTTRAEVSFDDGASWQSVPVEKVGGRFRAEIPAASGPGFATVRVVATDADGNRITQRIDRAWRIAP